MASIICDFEYLDPFFDGLDLGFLDLFEEAMLHNGSTGLVPLIEALFVSENGKGSGPGGVVGKLLTRGNYFVTWPMILSILNLSHHFEKT